MLTLVVQTVKHLPAMWKTWVQSLGGEDSLEKEMATHSSTLAWKIPWTEDPCRLQSMGCKELDTTEPFHFTSLILNIIHCLSASMIFPCKYFKYLYLLDALQPHIHIDILFSIVFHL